MFVFERLMIDGSQLKIFGMMIVFFLVDDKDGKSQFFEKTVLLTDNSMDVAFEMFFLMLSNRQID